MKGYKAFNKGLVCKGKQKRLTASAYYKLQNGEFVEVEE